MAFSVESLEVGRLYTRPQLADHWGYFSFNGFARGVFTPAGARSIVLFVTREKQASLTQYRDFVSGDHLYWEGQKGHGTDLRIANAYRTGESIFLFYRDIHHTPFRFYGQVLLTRFHPKEDAPSQFTFSLTHDLSAQDDLESRADELSSLQETERAEVVRARVGQGRFRSALLESWRECSVTGVARPDLLMASHIKPWRFSNNHERLDRFNGLLLLPQYDHLFDRGYITFHDSGEIEASPAISSLPTALIGIDPRGRLRRVEDEHKPFLDFHRREVFVARTANR